MPLKLNCHPNIYYLLSDHRLTLHSSLCLVSRFYVQHDMIKRHYILQSFLENESTTFQQNYLKKNFKYLTISTLLDPKEMDLAPCMDSENCEL